MTGVQTCALPIYAGDGVDLFAADMHDMVEGDVRFSQHFGMGI